MSGFHEFKVRVPDLPGVTVRDWKGYIDDAVGSWCGQYGGYPPEEDPQPPQAIMAHSGKMNRVKVTRILPKPRTRLQHVPPPMTLEEQLFHIKNGTIALSDEEKRLLLEAARRLAPPVPGVDDLLTIEERNALLKDDNAG